MSYSPTTWASGDIVTAQKLNNIEDGIVGLETDMAALDAGDIAYDSSESYNTDTVGKAISDVKSHLDYYCGENGEKVFSAYPTGEAAGDVVSFSDGAAGIPLKSLSVDIEMTQSGSGDPAPDNIRPITGYSTIKVYVNSVVDESGATEYDISIPATPGTVYNGTLNVKTGVLTVTSRGFDGGDVTWHKVTNNNYANFYYATDPVAYYDAYNSTVKCSIYKSAANNSGATSDGNYYTWVRQNSATNREIRVKDTSKSSLTEAQFKAAMVGVTFVYELKEPVTYNLTPTQVLSILGQNEIWANCNGELELEYRADPTLFAGGGSAAVSVFDKSSVSNFTGLPVTGYYKGLGSAYSESFGADTTTSAVITAIDALVASYGANYVTKTDLGACSDETNHLYEYAFKPKETEVSPNGMTKKHPTVLILSAQHGFEKSSVYGLYYFLRDLMTKWDEDPVLDYIRHHVILRIIPIANPYGFDHKTYNNANGVNLNRNYDTTGFPYSPSAQPGDSDYGGVTAFDQPETAIVRDWVTDNLNAVLFVDFHTNGQSSVTSYEKINWVSLCKAKDDFYARLWKVGAYHVENITAHFAKDYSLTLSTSMCGYVTGASKGHSTMPTADDWVTDQGVLGLTFEGFNGFVSETAFDADEQKANSELIGNFLIAALNELGK